MCPFIDGSKLICINPLSDSVTSNFTFSFEELLLLLSVELLFTLEGVYVTK